MTTEGFAGTLQRAARRRPECVRRTHFVAVDGGSWRSDWRKPSGFSRGAWGSSPPPRTPQEPKRRQTPRKLVRRPNPIVDDVSHMERVTLTQAARALGVPQHKLIHFCEKGVVVPDLHDARGRGSSRGFSRRNFFEFSVALEMRRLGLSVALIRAVLLVLRSFESAVASTMAGFALPASLQSSGAPTVTALIVDGQRLFFSVARGRSRP